MKTLSFLIATLCATTVHAKCIVESPQPTKVTATVEKIIVPVYTTSNITDYKTVDGCLLQTNGEILGYSNEQDICTLSPGFTGTFIIKTDCCDYLGMPPCDARAAPAKDESTLRAKGKFISLVKE